MYMRSHLPAHLNKVFAKLLLNNKLTKFQIDTGATCNIIPLSKLNEDQRKDINVKKKCVLRMYNNTNVSTYGEATLKLINLKTNDKYKLLCNVVDDSNSVMSCTPIIWNAAAQAMKLVKIKHENILKIDSNTQDLTENIIKSQFKDVFEG